VAVGGEDGDRAVVAGHGWSWYVSTPAREIPAAASASESSGAVVRLFRKSTSVQGCPARYSD
jgi:hypothetical protein